MGRAVGTVHERRFRCVARVPNINIFCKWLTMPFIRSILPFCNQMRRKSQATNTLVPVHKHVRIVHTLPRQHTPHDELELFPERKLLSGQTGNYELVHRRWPAAIIQTQNCSHSRIHSFVPSSLSSVALNTKNGTFRFSRFRSQNKNKKCLTQNDSILFWHSLYIFWHNTSRLLARYCARFQCFWPRVHHSLILGILLRCHALG